MRSFSYLNSAQRIIEEYKGNMPLAAWLKDFFRQEKKYGSGDRRQISHAVYSFYRLGTAFHELPVEERILTGLFLCSGTPSLILGEQRPSWNERTSLPLEEKINFISTAKEAGKIFPFTSSLSSEIDVDAFSLSMLLQPDLFLRLRPGKAGTVIKKLEQAGISFVVENQDVLRFQNQTKLEEVIEMDREAVVQDLNSQQVISLLEKEMDQKHKGELWDCCAASGGKSILAHDHFPRLRLTVSDVRISILHNLRNRFGRAGIQNYSSFVADLTAGYQSSKKFDVVICDAPCSGSGTWGRTPEQLSFFTTEKLLQYVTLQEKISAVAAGQLKAGGYFLYITCSVFEKENEGVVQSLRSAGQLELISHKYFKGYAFKADTLFAALFRAKA